MSAKCLSGFKIEVAYLYVAGNGTFHENAKNFAESMGHHPPECDHDLVILCNGGGFPDSIFPNARAFQHDGTG